MPEIILSKKKWEGALLQAYIEYTWHEILDPLYDKMQSWKAGKLDHDAILAETKRVQKDVNKADQLLRFNRPFVLSIVMANDEFFKPWLAEHPAPEGVTLPE